MENVNQKETTNLSYLPYVKLTLYISNLENIIESSELYVKCFTLCGKIEKYSLQSTTNWRKSLQWEANLRLGEILKIQVWKKKSGLDLFMGEVCFEDGSNTPSYISYEYFISNSTICNDYFEKPIFRDIQILNNGKNPEKFKLYALGKENRKIRSELYRDPMNPASLYISAYAQYSRSESIFKLITFYGKSLKSRKIRIKSKINKELSNLNIPPCSFNRASFSEFKHNIYSLEQPLPIFFVWAGLHKRTNEEDIILDIIRNMSILNSKNNMVNWSNFMESKNDQDIKDEFISLNRFAKFLSRIQKDRITKIKFQELFSRYPIPRHRAPEEYFVKNSSDIENAKIIKWIGDDKPKDNITNILQNLQINLKQIYIGEKKPKYFSRRMFFEYLFDPIENSIMDPKKEKLHKIDNYMNQPLSYYWIDSSYKTYFTGESQNKVSPEQYKKALLRGCRFIDFDVWDGENSLPMVFHYNSPNDSFPLFDALRIICESAFITSKYPVIILLRIHSTAKGIKKLLNVLKSLLNDPKYNMLCNVNNTTFTPNSLQKKILLKISFDTDSEVQKEIKDNRELLKNIQDLAEVGRTEIVNIFTGSKPLLDKEKHKDFGISLDNMKNILQQSSHFISKSNLTNDVESEKELCFTSITEGNNILGDITLLQKYSTKEIIRVYPNEERIDSCNYNPLPLWETGCQIVSLNYQHSDIPMWMNEGKFMRAGHTGYVLKPTWLISGGNSTNTSTNLAVKVISGWRLPRPYGTKQVSSKISRPIVEVSLWTHKTNIDNSIDEPPNVKSFSTTSPINGEDNPYNPIWYNGQEPFIFNVEDEDLDMLLFKVLDTSPEESFIILKKDVKKVIGYYAITVADIREGLRVVPLKGEYGAPLISGDLIVEIHRINREQEVV